MQKGENKITKLLIDTCILPGRHICQIAFSFFLSRVYFKRKVFATEVAIMKNAYSNKLKILQPKTENFQVKTSDIFHVSAQNIDCRYSLEPPRRGGSNEYLNLCFLAKQDK